MPFFRRKQNTKDTANQIFTRYLCPQDWISLADPYAPARGVLKGLPRLWRFVFSFVRVREQARSRSQTKKPLSFAEGPLCPGLDSNQHTLRRCYLKTVRLPISPPGHTHNI